MSSLNNRTIIPGDTIGIIGGGQLGRMMALSAKSLGFRVAVLDPTQNCPCGQVSDIEINGAYDDLDALKELASVSDVITFEFENISSEALEWLEDHAYVPQGSELLRITQDRLLEKAAISMTGATVAPYFAVNNLHDLYNGIEKVGYPCVLKTARGGYDGKGQQVIRTEKDIELAKDILIKGKCVLEAWIPFVKEVSAIITRKANGESSCFPVAENVHVNNILDKSIVPGRITEKAEAEAVKQAQLIAEELDLVGTLAVEMFLTEKDEIIINELAPRPHNSGHYTINACETSQFEQHIRAICNWPLGNTELLKPVVMVNILGQHLEGILTNLSNFADWKIHLYGKKDAKRDRKMGHINILRPTIDMALTEINGSGLWKPQAETEDIK
ncbi:5-(carboxyamino)imidazole ribonucleotide synthase [Bacillus sp. V5-8f]|uniref:5-(carboxyamino)imidazole ribonucleotide synthase n=1 Tax=Bacillus sp. V5-8f TaxID=2053044 RepID=UPI000C76CF6E|nr:5-(carboxyamino)imidazole ribonucleotide synthase [Bacillus sp. V5-8f]PLT33289.1 5-(carboxyamino)imidazole ribonucleotide synthase [Bacillus sp. V5-8f]